MASRSMGLARSACVKASCTKRSGAHSTNRTSPRLMRSMASRVSAGDCVLVTIATGSPAASSLACWSLMSAMSGLTTTVRPPLQKAGAWKHRLLPDPVGITTRLSAPASAARMGRSCAGRSAVTPIWVSTSRSGRGSPPGRGGMGASSASRRARSGAAMRPSAVRASPCRSRQSSRRASSRRSAVAASSGGRAPLCSARDSTYARSATESTGRSGMVLTGGRM